jgi:moderate conductance mechanosensitive channel
MHILDLWSDDVANWVRHDLLRLAGILVVALILIELVRILTKRLAHLGKAHELPSGVRAQQLRTLAQIINSFAIAIIIFFALMQALPLFGIDMKPLLASAGIAGLAIGFGAQTLVHDVINGFFILVENQYDVGDNVQVAGVRGNVEVMTLRRTMLRDDAGTVHIIPNSQITVVSNYTRDWTQLQLHVTAAYSENSDKVIKVLQEVAAELYNDPRFQELLVAEPEVPGIERVSGTEVDYLMIAKTRPGKQFIIRRELQRRVKECFEKNDIRPGAPSRFFVDAVPPGK